MVTVDPYLPSEVRRLLAFKMRREGMKFREIGQVFGVSANRAMQLVKRAQRECSAGFLYRHRDPILSESEAQALLPLIDFLREIADGTTDTN